LLPPPCPTRRSSDLNRPESPRLQLESLLICTRGAHSSHKASRFELLTQGFDVYAEVQETIHDVIDGLSISMTLDLGYGKNQIGSTHRIELLQAMDSHGLSVLKR